MRNSDWKSRAIEAYQHEREAQSDRKIAANHREAREARAAFHKITGVVLGDDCLRLDGMIMVDDHKFASVLFDNIALVAECEHCGEIRQSEPITSMAELGKALAGDFWDSPHDCRSGPATSQAQKLITALDDYLRSLSLA